MQRPFAWAAVLGLPALRLAPLLCALLALAGGARADVVNDGSLGAAGPVAFDGTTWRITEDLGQRSGANLFHSFSLFDIAAAQTASFQPSAAAPPPPERVIARVTGGSPSQFDGRLQSLYPGADLYLLNPNGVIFGPNSTVDIRGSLHVSTADEVRDSAGHRFSAAAPEPPSLLFTARPEAFGFLRAAPAPIEIAGSDAQRIEVRPGETVDLIGGDVRLSHATVWAPGGLVRIAALGSPGEVRDPGDGGFAVAASGRLGAIEIVDDSIVSVSGLEPELGVPRTDPDPENGGPIPMDPEYLVSSGFALRVPAAAILPGDVEIGKLDHSSQIFVLRPNTGRIFARGDSLRVRDSDLRARSFGAISGGIEIDVDGLLRIEKIATGEESVGFLARSEVTRLAVEMDSVVGATFPAKTYALAGSGAGANVEIRAGEIEMRGGALITASSDTSASGGQIDVRAEGAIVVSGLVGWDVDRPTAIFSNAQGTGDGGDIRIEAQNLRLEHGGAIIAQTTGNANGGDIHVAVDRLEILGISQIDASTSAQSLPQGSPATTSGAGGTITVRARHSARLACDGSCRDAGATDERGEFARISTFSSARSTGASGSIAVSTPRLEIERGARISATTRGAGPGGNVALEVGTLVVRDGSSVEARAVGSAPGSRGGAIEIHADNVFVDWPLGLPPYATQPGRGDSFVSADGGVGVDGTVVIDSPEVNVAAQITPLEAAYLDASALLRPSCAARASSTAAGSLTVARRPEAPTPDDEALETPAARDAFELVRDGHAAVEAGGGERANTLLRSAQLQVDALAPDRARAALLLHLGRAWEALSRRPADEKTGLLEAHAALLAALRLGQSLGDARTVSQAAGALGALYERERRYGEALYLTREALRAAERADALELLSRWSGQEGRVLWARGEAAPAISAYRRAVVLLEEARQGSLARHGSAPERFRDEVAPVYRAFVDALLQSSGRAADAAAAQPLLREARIAMEGLKAAELRDYFRDECVTELEAARMPLEGVSAKAAVIYPILLDDRLEILIGRYSGVSRHTVPVGAEELTREVRALRNALGSPAAAGFRAPAERLYAWLVEPYADALAAQGVDTLVFVPDGALSTIPMAALHDGTRYVGERFAVAVTPGLSLVAPHALDIRGGRMLLAGLSESAGGFPALPQVKNELAAIHALYSGDVVMDAAFRVDSVEEAMRERPRVVHLATHAVFTGDAESSFLLTHDGRLTMQRLGEVVGLTRFGDEPLELLTLSACETAAGDDRAALGLSGVAVRAGARSALGTLWAVPDASTYELIVAFYRQLEDPGVSKAEALRRAQTQLRASPHFAHPYYWAPFLLINNWL